MTARIVPRKANWDLKRDIAPKLAILSARTQEAIDELVRARAAEQQAGASGPQVDVDLARMVAAHGEQQHDADDTASGAQAHDLPAAARDAAEVNLDDL